MTFAMTVNGVQVGSSDYALPNAAQFITSFSTVASMSVTLYTGATYRSKAKSLQLVMEGSVFESDYTMIADNIQKWWREKSGRTGMQMLAYDPCK